MSDGVLPALLVLPVEREQVHDPLVDLVQGQHLAAGLLDGHGDQGDVRVRRLGVRVAPPVRFGFSGSEAAAGRAVHRAHHRHAAVRRRADGAHVRRQRGAQPRYPGPRALRHPSGHRRVVDPHRVHVVRVHVSGAGHARRAHVAVHRVHGETGSHVSCCRITLRHRNDTSSHNC